MLNEEKIQWNYNRFKKEDYAKARDYLAWLYKNKKDELTEKALEFVNKELNLLESDQKKKTLAEYKDLLKKGEFEKAEYKLYLLINYYPNDEKAKFEYARLLVRVGKREEGQKLLEELTNGENYRYALIELARLEINKGQYNQAREHLERLLKTKESKSYALLELSYIDIKEGRYKEALDKIKEIKQNNDLLLNSDNNPIRKVETYLYIKLGLALSYGMKKNKYLVNLMLSNDIDTIKMHVRKHFQNDEGKNLHTKFKEGINHLELLESISSNLNEKTYYGTAFYDKYLISYPNIGFYKDRVLNHLLVVTLPNEPEKIVTMYPYEVNLEEKMDKNIFEIIEDSEKNINPEWGI